MRIVFDAYWWVSGPPSLRHVLRETVMCWHRLYPQDEIILVVPKKHLGAVKGSVPASFRIKTTSLWPQAFSAVWSCSRVQKRTKADVLYTQNFAAPFATFSAVFIHDVLFKTNPEWFTLSERIYFSFMPILAGYANLVLTSSATEALRIRQHTSAREVCHVGIGMSEELLSSPEVAGFQELKSKRFLLTVGRLNVRKNLANTIAGAVASGQLSKGQPLVVVGSADGRSEDLAPELAKYVRDGLVIFTGFVDDGQLRWLYQNTRLFLFMTQGEGYGMPPVEALHFGAPMIVSDIDVFREILPSYIERIAPNDVRGLGRAIGKRLRNDHWHPEGEQDVQSEEYSWIRTVTKSREAIMAQLSISA